MMPGRLDLDDPDVIHLACPKSHPFVYVTSKGFGWCPECVRHWPATLEAERAAQEPWYQRRYGA